MTPPTGTPPTTPSPAQSQADAPPRRPRPDEGPARAAALGEAIAIVEPSPVRLPVVLASPHSGRIYPPAFLAASRLDPLALRKSEDAFVDELLMPATELGTPLIAAQFPRAFLDVNREPFELDPDMFDQPLPAYAQARSPRVAAGLGTIPRVVAQGEEIYAGRLSLAEAVGRIRTYYRPYHASLRRLVDTALAAFGYCILVDGHSMPSLASIDGHPPMTGNSAPHFVLGDCHGSACHPAITDAAQEFLTRAGYRIARNTPYSGGYTTRHYGRPHGGVHALQIEVARSLYMDEARVARGVQLDRMAAVLKELTQHLAEAAGRHLDATLRAAE